MIRRDPGRRLPSRCGSSLLRALVGGYLAWCDLSEASEIKGRMACASPSVPALSLADLPVGYAEEEAGLSTNDGPLPAGTKLSVYWDGADVRHAADILVRPAAPTLPLTTPLRTTSGVIRVHRSIAHRRFR